MNTQSQYRGLAADRGMAITPKNTRLLLGLAALPLALGAALEIQAQPDGQQRQMQLEEIVVTASRREESLQDVATSITAISGAALEARGITNFEDIKRAAAGLYLERPTFSGSASLRMRGVGSGSFSGLDPSVGVLVDGVYQLREGFAFTELMDLERIEVMRGPQGTLFGRNTTSGVIHIHTRNPDTSELSGKLQGVVGNLNAREMRGSVNIPLIQDTLAIRVSGNWVERDGHTKNTFLDRDTRNQERHGGRFKLLWNATDNLEVLWSSDYQKSKGRFDVGTVQYGVDNITNLPGFANQPWSNIATALGKTLPPISLGRAAQNPAEYQDEMERHVLTLNWSLPGHNLQSITAHEKFDSYQLDDRDRTIMDLSFLTNESSTKARSQEFILSSELDGPFSYIVGAYYQKEKLDSPTNIFNGPDLNALRATMGLGPASPIPTISLTTRDNEFRALFGTLTYELTDQWSLVGGLRYTSDVKNVYSTLNIPGLPLIAAVDNKKTFDEITYTAKVLHNIDADRMVYLSLDRGFKSGGFNRQNTSCVLAGANCLTPEQLVYDAETTDSVELGLKSEWLDGRVRLNGAVFYQVYDDFQVSQSLPAQATTLIDNAAKVEAYGTDVDLFAVLTDNLTLDIAVALVRAEYDKFEGAPCGIPNQPRCVGGVQDLSGKQLDNAPRMTANAGLAYQAALPNVNGLEWFARLDASYRSSANLHVAQTAGTDQGGYSLYSAQVGLESSDGQWKVTAWGRNLTNKTYTNFSLVDIGGLNRVQGLTRTYGVTLDWNF